jgi:hypothetical protein
MSICVNPVQGIKRIVLVVLILLVPSGYAFDKATLKINAYTTKGWQLEGIGISLNNVSHNTQKLALTINSLKLPKPFDDIKAVDVSCTVFVWRPDEIVCQQGHAKIQSKRWQSPATDFAFSLNKKNSSLTLTNLKVADGTVFVQATMHNNHWQLAIAAKNINGKALKSYLPPLPIEIKDGKADIKLTASGESSDVKQLSLDTMLTRVKVKGVNGQFSTEKLTLNSQLIAKNDHGLWQWQNHSRLQQGAITIDPVHLEVGAKPVLVEAKGVWKADNNHLTVQTLTITNMKIADGTVFAQAKMDNKNWQVDLDAKNVNTDQLKHYFPSLPLQLKGGKANITLMASGIAADVKQVNLNTVLTQVDVQNQSGLFATEKLTLANQLIAQNDHGLWHWQNQSRLQQGALYVDPVYLEVGTQPVVIDAKGLWNTHKKRVTVENINYQHPGTGALNGNGVVSYGQKIHLDKAELSLRSLGLQNLFSVYIKPFFDPATVEGVSLEGNAQGRVILAKNALTDASLNFDKLTVKDTGHRLRVKQGSGAVNWSSKIFETKLSHLAWQQLSLFNLPIGSSQLDLSGWANNIRLVKQARLPFLGGAITVNQFSWYAKPQEEPDIAFAGKIENVSLEKLSRVMQWTPLSGKISGHIPGVSYYEKTLRLGGELTINVFDGTIKLSNLASVGLFSDYPVVYSDFELDNLDLDQITRKFEFGNITGRLSGYVKELTLENWRPTRFLAWLGTPENDDSSHRISQKAVNNIASIGGGGATDILSRSFLSMFETFGYDKIGIGCYLNKGVCQMMGVKATPQGYYLITGGGLPRIDVMGYNPQVDWQVLMERLGRISASDEVIVQ